MQYRSAGGELVEQRLAGGVRVDSANPHLSWEHPSLRQVPPGTVRLVVSAMDASGVERVEFYEGDTLLETARVRPYSARWEAGLDAEGDPVSKSLRVKAYDQVGRVAELSRSIRVAPPVVVAADTQSPGVSGLDLEGSPCTQCTDSSCTVEWSCRGSGKVSVSVRDNVGVRRVVVLLDGVEWAEAGAGSAGSYAADVDWSRLSVGQHRLRVEAEDDSGNRAAVSGSLAVTEVAVPSAPELSQPAEGQVLQAKRLLVRGTAQPGVRVRLYLNSVALERELRSSLDGSFASQLELELNEGGKPFAGTGAADDRGCGTE